MKLYGVVEQTVQNWCKAGLKRVPDVPQVLVCGEALNAFHEARSRKARKPLSPTEFLCLTCHEAREPEPTSIVGADPFSPSLHLAARCSICAGAVYRAWSRTAALALSSRADLMAPSPDPPFKPPGSATETAPEMRRGETVCDIKNFRASRKPENPVQTTEGPDDTSVSAQLSLSFEFQTDNRR